MATMRNFLSAALSAAPLVFLAQPASAQYFSGYTNSIGNNTYGTYNTPYGQIRTNSQQIGNTIYSNAYGPNGSSARCTTQIIGNNVYQNCY